MRIAQIAPLYESVPPKLYGGTERIVSFLTEELVSKGHEVTLFASGDSITSASLVPQVPSSLRVSKNCIDPIAHHINLIEQVYKNANQFDIIHSHIDYFAFPLARRSKIPTITTLHGRLDLPDLLPLYKEYKEMPLVSISNAQRLPLKFANWLATIHHGIPKDLLSYTEKPGSYLAFLGRVCPEKGLEEAIQIAQIVGMPLKIAAKVDKADIEYFDLQIRPLIKDVSNIEFIGEINDKDKGKFLGEAYALLFPINWPEPFGIVMIEAMACGTPTIAFNYGSVPEVITEGITGFIVNNIPEAIEAISKISQFSRKECREKFEKRFDASIMTDNYLKLFEKILEKENTSLFDFAGKG